MQLDSEPCDSSCFGACEQKEKPEEYNDRVQEAITSLQKAPSYAIVDRGVNGNDKSCILVLNGKLYGMGYIPPDVQITEPETLLNFMTRYRENNYINNLINNYAARFPGKVRVFELETVQSSQ